jgi:hypothetical protein
MLLRSPLIGLQRRAVLALLQSNGISRANAPTPKQAGRSRPAVLQRRAVLALLQGSGNSEPKLAMAKVEIALARQSYYLTHTAYLRSAAKQ